MKSLPASTRPWESLTRLTWSKNNTNTKMGTTFTTSTSPSVTQVWGDRSTTSTCTPTTEEVHSFCREWDPKEFTGKTSCSTDRSTSTSSTACSRKPTVKTTPWKLSSAPCSTADKLSIELSIPSYSCDIFIYIVFMFCIMYKFNKLS